MLDGSIAKFSMDNCSFDPTKRVLGFDSQSPSGYYRLDLADAEEREICKKLISECKSRKQDIFRNEKIDGTRINLPKHVVMGGYDGNWRGWEVRRGFLRKVALSRSMARAYNVVGFEFLCIDANQNSLVPCSWLHQPPAHGIMETDIAVMNNADHYTITIHQGDFRVLTKAMESTGSDSAKLALLKQALAGIPLPCLLPS